MANGPVPGPSFLRPRSLRATCSTRLSEMSWSAAPTGALVKSDPEPGRRYLAIRPASRAGHYGPSVARSGTRLGSAERGLRSGRRALQCAPVLLLRRRAPRPAGRDLHSRSAMWEVGTDLVTACVPTPSHDLSPRFGDLERYEQLEEMLASTVRRLREALRRHVGASGLHSLPPAPRPDTVDLHLERET